MGKCGIINQKYSRKSEKKGVESKQEATPELPQTPFHALLLEPEGHGDWVRLCDLETESTWAPGIWERTFHTSVKELSEVLGYWQVRLISFPLPSNKKGGIHFGD